MDGISDTEVKTKIVVVGDCGCGKTTMIKRYVSNTFVEAYTPTGFDTYNATYQASAAYKVHLSIWDTSGNSSYDRVRPVSYTGADLVLACFSIVNPDSLHNIVTKWLPEIKEHCPTAPIIVVGLGSDLRTDEQTLAKLARRNTTPITYEQGLKAAKDIDALVYSETSSKTSESSVRDVMEVAALSSMGTKARTAQASESAEKRKSMKKKKTKSMGEAKDKIKTKKESDKGCSIM